VITLLFRMLLLLTVLTSLFVRFHGLRNSEETSLAFNVDAAVRETIEKRGLLLRENPAPPKTALGRAIYFQRPECSQASWVMPFSLSAEVLIYLKQVIKPGFEHRLVYLDKSWKDQDRLDMYFEWAKNRFLGGVGRPRYFTEKTALVVVEPSDCRQSVAIDWRQVWSRDRRGAAEGEQADFTKQRQSS
jgi:hypothetical protein